MLLLNDNHRLRAGMAGMTEQCLTVPHPFNEYPLIMSDNTQQTVYHVACAIELATEIMVDTPFSAHQLPTRGCLSSRHPKHLLMPHRNVKVLRRHGGEHAVNQRASDQGGYSRSSIHCVVGSMSFTGG